MARNKRTDHDVLLTDGVPTAFGRGVSDGCNRILDAPDVIPILIIGLSPSGDLGIRAFGKPSLVVADILDRVAKDYRASVKLATSKRP